MSGSTQNPVNNWACIDILPAAYLLDPNDKDSVFLKNNTHLFEKEFLTESDIPYPTISWVDLAAEDFKKFFDIMWNLKKFDISTKVYVSGTSGSGIDQKNHLLDFVSLNGDFLYLETNYAFKPPQENPPNLPSEGFWHDWKIMHYDYDPQDRNIHPLFCKMLGLTKTATIDNTNNSIYIDRDFLSWDNSIVESHPFPTFKFSVSYRNNCSLQLGEGQASKKTIDISGMSFVESRENITVTNFPCEVSFSIRSIYINPETKIVRIFFEFLLDSSVGCAVTRDPSSYSKSKNFDFKILNKTIGRPIKLSYNSDMSISSAIFRINIEEMTRF